MYCFQSISYLIYVHATFSFPHFETESLDGGFTLYKQVYTLPRDAREQIEADLHAN
jgi:hypothetical protein